MGKQQTCNFRVPTVAGPVQGCGTPVGLGVTLCSTFQQKLANSIVPIATSIVQGSVTGRVRLAGVCGLLDEMFHSAQVSIQGC